MCMLGRKKGAVWGLGGPGPQLPTGCPPSSPQFWTRLASQGSSSLLEPPRVGKDMLVTDGWLRGSEGTLPKSALQAPD